MNTRSTAGCWRGVLTAARFSLLPLVTLTPATARAVNLGGMEVPKDKLVVSIYWID